MKCAFREVSTPAASVTLSERDIKRLEATFNSWLATKSPVSAEEVRHALEKLGFFHRAPRGGGSHSSMCHPSGATVGLIAKTGKASTQYDAARAGLTILGQIRAERAPPEPPPPPVPKSKPTPPDLFSLIPEDCTLSPLEGFEGTYVLRSRDFPQLGTVLYTGASPKAVEAATHEILSAAAQIQNILLDRESLEFDIEYNQGALCMRHRVHTDLSCILPPYDPFSDRKASDLLQTLKGFITDIYETDDLTESTRGHMFSFLGLEESRALENPDGSRTIPCRYTHLMTDESRRTTYTRSPQGRVSLHSLLKIQDGIYADILGSLKKDAKRFYGLEVNQPEQGILHIWHPFYKSIDFQILDLKHEPLTKAYEHAIGAETPEACRTSQHLLEEKTETLRKILEAREKSVQMINDLASDFMSLMSCAHSVGMRMCTYGGTKIGQGGRVTFSYVSDEGQQSCSVAYLTCAITEAQGKECSRIHIPIPKLIAIPSPRDIVALHAFLMNHAIKNMDPMGNIKQAVPPVPLKAIEHVAANEGHAFPPGAQLAGVSVRICYPQPSAPCQHQGQTPSPSPS